MGDRVSLEFKQLLDERKLFRTRISSKMISKEVASAEADLKDAQDSLKQKKFKWATIQGYYSTFHSARALLYSRGFRERSHYAVLVAMRELFVNALGKDLIQRFGDAMELRQEADYASEFSEAGAIETIEGAEEFLRKAKEILKKVI